MSDLTPEELALLAAEDAPTVKKPHRPKSVERHEEPAAAPAPITGSIPRGPFTPVQYDDDGWGGLPVQMRG